MKGEERNVGLYTEMQGECGLEGERRSQISWCKRRERMGKQSIMGKRMDRTICECLEKEG
jgi:hypothetical protein